MQRNKKETLVLRPPLMDSEKVLQLYDSCWFEREIFKKEMRMRISSDSEANPELKSQEEASKPVIFRTPSIHRRSMSEDLSLKTSFVGDSPSPDTVLFPAKLQTIFSGKEVKREEVMPEKKVSEKRRRLRRLRSESKSLSELEFAELKGFMDLGFFFTEEDKDSSLIAIIPGLQRLGQKEEEEAEETAEESAIARPYLSEAWEVMERRAKRENPLIYWRIPSSSNEIDVKDSLRWWAHTVASTVR